MMAGGCPNFKQTKTETMLPLFQITNVAESRAGKAYANDLVGRTFFPKTGDMELTKGHYAYFVETMQTKTRDENGELTDLTTPVKILQITATWATKAEALTALTEMNLLGAEVHAETAKQAKALGLNDKQVAELAAAW